jgi:probable F420-dependent oxidoreductase
MNLGRVGIWSSGLRLAAERGEGAEVAAELEELGYGALFLPGGRGGNILGAVANTLRATRSVPVVTGILNLWMHDPAEVAERFAALDAEHPGRFQLGIGISHAPLVDSVEGKHYGKPLATTRAYLDALDAAPTPVPPERRLIAALGPKMLELARDRSAGTHPYLVPPAHTRFARSVVGDGKIVAPEQTVLVETDPQRARAEARAFMEMYLGLPNYTNNLLRHGFEESDLADGGSDRLVDAIVAWGDEAAIAARVREHHDAGADHVCIQVIGGDRSELKLDDWRRLAPALTN